MKKGIKVVIISAILTCSVGGAFLWFSKKSEIKKPSITSVELQERRTENKKVYLNSDGTVTERIYQNSINYKDGDVYKEIDNRLEPKEVNGEKKLENKANSVKVILDLQRKSDNLINMKFGKYSVAFSPNIEERYKNNNFTVLGLKKSDIDNDIILKNYNQQYDKFFSDNKDIYGLQYDHLYSDEQDISFQYIPMSDGVKENIVLNKYNKKNSFDFTLDLSELMPEKVENGGIILRDKTTKEEKAFIAPPFVHDSSKEQRETDNNSIQIENIKGDQYKVSIIVDKDYLENKNTVYPVVIDPYVTSLTTNHYTLGSCIKSQYPDYNFASDPYLRAGNWTGSDPSGIMYSYLKFTSLPEVPGSKIISAKMNLYSENTGTGAMNVEMHRITTDWDYTTVKWNKRPVWNDPIESKITVGNNTGWFTWDITSLIKSFVDKTVTNYGIFMKKDDSASPTIRKFNSPNNSNPPYLEVIYKVPDSTKMNVATSNNASEFINQSKGYINLSWNPVSNADGYMIQVWNGSAYVQIQDVGNRTSWSTKERKFWPTLAEVAAGNGAIHGNDNNGSDYLPDNPHPVYVINKMTNPAEAYTYFFRVQAYYTAGANKIMSALIAPGNINLGSASIPDTTAPSTVNNIQLSSKLTDDLSKWQINCSFDSSKDNPEAMATGISKYVVELYNGSNVKVDSKEVTSTSTTFTTDLDNSSFYVKVYAYDKNGNYSISPNSSTTTTGTRITSKEVVYFKASKDSLNVGDDFDIYVNAKGIDNVLAAAIDFKFDNSLISVTDIVPGTGWEAQKAYTYKKSDTGNQGLISFYSVKQDASVSITDSTVFTIKAKALKAGSISLKADDKNDMLDNLSYNLRVKFSDENAKLIHYQSVKNSINIK